MIKKKVPGLVLGVVIGFIAAATITYAANIGILRKGHAVVSVYQNDSNPQVIYYDISLNHNLKNSHKLSIINWGTAVRVTAEPK